MKKFNKLSILAFTISTVLYGCGDAETTIIEKEPIIESEEDGHDDDHDHGTDDGFIIESMGRLAVLSAQSNQASVFDIEHNELLETFTLIHDSNTLTYSAGYRFAIVTSRNEDYLGFIDGGIWREDHVDHLHDTEQAPEMSTMQLSSSRPTHITKHEGKTAVFFDGDADSSIAASVQVFSDTDISSENSDLDTLHYDINMHGVAEPKGDYLVSTIRRDDAETTSAATILPDQVGVYLLHDGEYEQQQVIDVTCPDLHGAAQNEDFTVFGCGDGVLVVGQDESGVFSGEKIANISQVEGLRIGSLYGHEASESIIGTASAFGVEGIVLVSINPSMGMSALDWQPENDASPVSYAFSHNAEHFVVLDNQGYLNILSANEQGDSINWQLEERLDISEQDVSTMPEDMSFSMTMAQNGDYVYVSDPIAQHILQINLETMEIEGDIEIDFSAASLVWLGIAEAEEHDH